MRGTLSWRTTSACFPRARSTWQQARAEPIASPSGRAWEVSTKRSCCPICRSTSSSMSLCRLSTGILSRLAALFRAGQQLFNARLILLGAVEAEKQLGCPTKVQALDQFVTNIFASSFQAFDALVGVRVVTFYVDPDFSRASIVGDMHGGHTDQADSRVSQLALDQGFNLFAQSFTHPPAMVLQPALLHESPQVKRMRISENQVQMCAAAYASRDFRRRDFS